MRPTPKPDMSWLKPPIYGMPVNKTQTSAGRINRMCPIEMFSMPQALSAFFRRLARSHLLEPFFSVLAAITTVLTLCWPHG